MNNNNNNKKNNNNKNDDSFVIKKVIPVMTERIPMPKVKPPKKK